MSLIVTRIDADRVYVVCDTKLTYPNHEIKRGKANPSEGSIKAIIINPNLCIAFAGEMDFAVLAIAEIDSSCTFEEAKEILFKYHQLSNSKTDFIVCKGIPKPEICEIKNNKVATVPFSWIGNSDAYNVYQSAYLSPEQPKTTTTTTPSVEGALPGITISELNFSVEFNAISETFSKMSKAMDGVIADGNIDSVGGFRVSVAFNQRFHYTKYTKLYRGDIPWLCT